MTLKKEGKDHFQKVCKVLYIILKQMAVTLFRKDKRHEEHNTGRLSATK